MPEQAESLESTRCLVLVIEDDWAIQQLLEMTLIKAGFEVKICQDTDQAWDYLLDGVPALLILDWMLPGQSGVEFLQELRCESSLKDVPVLMLTARSTEGDRVFGLDEGADDYVSKPFSPKELIARVRALLRRVHSRPLAGETLTVSSLVMDITKRRVWRDNVELHLGPTEFRLLRHLMHHPGRIYSRTQLLDSVWGRQTYVEERTVDVHIKRLRQSLNQNGGKDLIRTVRSVGYSLQE